MTTNPPQLIDANQRCQLCAARMSCVVGQLPRSQQERLDPLIRELDFRKGEQLQVEGVEPATVRSIKLGTVMLKRDGPDGQARPVGLAGRGHLLGLWGMVGMKTQIGAEALSAGRLCELPAAALATTLGKDPALNGPLQRQMHRAFARLADWGQVMRLRGLHRQIVGALMLLAQEQGTRTVHLPSQIAMAALLATTRESVARTLRQLQDAGYLRRHDRWHGELSGTHMDVFRDSD
ncbi:Crp/Fnr family transcriptional regulator [Hydrogenophaga sp.]|uniref:Crp/Fnr family transcriptional regulator n=1 Tax=Hydrogenophaga sp. TaxID=1904254 RepID=UPI0035B2EB14